jgi:hypothetical protein
MHLQIGKFQPILIQLWVSDVAHVVIYVYHMVPFVCISENAVGVNDVYETGNFMIGFTFTL